MTPQAHLIGQDYSVYYDLIAVVVFLFFCMALCSLWLVRQKRSSGFIGVVWTVFIVLVSLGTLGVMLSIHTQRLLWLDAGARLVTSYADVVSRLDHWKIQPGHPELFSDWSPPFLVPIDSPSPPERPKMTDHFSEFNGDRPPKHVKLAPPADLVGRWKKISQAEVPGWENPQRQPEPPLHVLRRNQWAVAALTGVNEAFNHCPHMIVAQWEPVPNATTYRLQWGEYKEEETKWFTVYTGSTPFCVLKAPEGIDIALRVRAEDGTPEDDPNFNKMIDILDSSVRADRLIGYAYTLRMIDKEKAQFIVAPISDANHNSLIDADEQPCDIGEVFALSQQLFHYVLDNYVAAIELSPDRDQWGQWCTIAEPLWTPEGELDGILGMDFNVDLVHQKLFAERIYPLCLFVLATFLYFGAVLNISYLQMEERTIRRLAAGLRETNLSLTEAKQSAEKALQVKTLFLTNMSHEFRTPLNAMLGFAEILALRSSKCIAEENNICIESVKQIREHGNNLLELVDNVLNVAALNENQTIRIQMNPVHLRSLIADVADALRIRAASKSLTLTVVESHDMPEWIESDSAHLRQILIHLVGNAIKFTNEGGISIRAGISPEPSFLFISISDTGIGIAPNKLNSIFKPFSQSDPTSTRQYGGTGIGLSVAQHSAEMLNGWISVESQPEQGSTFTFTFPGKPVEPPPLEVPKDQQKPVLLKPQPEQGEEALLPSEIQSASGTQGTLAGCRVLYVEDTKVNQIVLSAQLKKVGATVEIAENGRIGIDKIMIAEKQGQPFDMILMDMQMPVMDGYEATRHLRADGYSKPIIAVTAHALPGDREKTLEAGCNEYVTKPVDFIRLIEKIKTFWK